MRRVLVVAVALVVLLGGALGGYVLWVRHAGRDVRGSSTVEFVPPRLNTTTALRLTPPRARRVSSQAEWATYGFDAARLRVDVTSRVRPPFRRTWTFHGRVLLEFPPAVAYGLVYLPTFDGRFYALDDRTGHVRWRWTSGRCGWSSPAVVNQIVYATFIGRTVSCGAAVPGADGIVVALSARSGHVRWLRTIGPTESSPLVSDGVVYVGDWNGIVWALDARTGRTRWKFTGAGRIKGSLARSGSRLFIGDYAGHLYALDVRTGREIWRASAQPRLGATGSFYSTPAVAYGRVYIGSTDGKLYSFGATSGRLRWSRSTGGYVYASPAVWHLLVLAGSYDHTFYALDAATGETRWEFRANGPISGSASVIDGVVYFSTFADRTYALDAATGRLLWTWPDGHYSPAVADSQRLYLVGLGRLYGMVPRK